jgi:hypothetical protein
VVRICLNPGQIADFKNYMLGVNPKNTRVACHDTPDKNEARGLKKRQSTVDFPARSRFFAYGGVYKRYKVKLYTKK